jgi:hypothetical protein
LGEGEDVEQLLSHEAVGWANPVDSDMGGKGEVTRANAAFYENWLSERA